MRPQPIGLPLDHCVAFATHRCKATSRAEWPSLPDVTDGAFLYDSTDIEIDDHGDVRTSDATEWDSLRRVVHGLTASANRAHLSRDCRFAGYSHADHTLDRHCP